jgi:hypothetical protein
MVHFPLRQRCQRLLANNRNIRRIDAATQIDIFPEVRGVERLERLLADHRNISGIYSTARINIAE